MGVLLLVAVRQLVLAGTVIVARTCQTGTLTSPAAATHSSHLNVRQHMDPSRYTKQPAATDPVRCTARGRSRTLPQTVLVRLLSSHALPLGRSPPRRLSHQGRGTEPRVSM